MSLGPAGRGRAGGSSYRCKVDGSESGTSLADEECRSSMVGDSF